MENTEQYEGKIIDYYFHEGDLAQARVVACDYGIGITLQLTGAKMNDFRYIGDMDVRGEQMTCIHGPDGATPLKYSPDEEHYKAQFEGIVAQIKTGTYRQDEPGFGTPTCAFSA